MPPKITIDLSKLPYPTAEKILRAIDEAAKVKRLENIDFRSCFSPMTQKVIDSQTRALKKIEKQCVTAVDKMNKR
jgi:hypothetical protein